MIPRHVEDDLRRLASMAVARDRRAPEAGPWVDGADTEDVARAVYASWYLGVADPSRPGAATADPQGASVARSADERHVAALLRAAHADGARFDDGWVVVATDGPVSVVERDGDQRVVLPGDLANLRRPAAPVHPGDEVAVVRRRDSVDPATGFWVTRAACGEPDGAIGRLYLNVTLDTVAPVLRLLTDSLTGLDDVCWSLKCPTDPLAYGRVDAIVCYVPRSDEGAVRSIARMIVDRVAGLLVPRVPPLTDPIGPGIAWADDPGTSDSFGMHRCRALTPAVIRIATDRQRQRSFDALVGALVDAGIDPCAPWRATRSGALT